MKTLQEIEDALTAPGQPFEMVEADVGGQALRVWKNAPLNMSAVFDAAAGWGDRTFIVYENERTTYRELHGQAVHLANVLRDTYGVAKGDRVAIAMRNYPEWPVAFWATLLAGAVAVPLNAWWSGPELEYGLRDSGSKVLFADPERIAALQPHLANLDLAAVIAVRGADSADVIDYATLISQASDSASPPAVEIEPDDHATIFYTSGTTGQPKGAVGTHRNICTALTNLAYSVARAALRAGETPPDPTAASGEQDALLLSVPFFHVTGCHGVLLGATMAGAKLVLMYKWSPERALELIERERVTTFGGVPSMAWQVLESPDFHKRDTSSVKSIGYGGAPAPPELVRRLNEMFPGRTPSNGWGMTETSAGVTFNAGIDYLERPDSAGQPVPVCDLKIIDESGETLGPNELGELCVRGPNVVKGYWNKPEATQETFGGGWLRTGDIARIDEDGFIYLVDRLKDMVIRGGENVYCAEVEAALFEHPDVSDAAVIGVPHKVLGEEVGAVILLRPGTKTTVESIQDHVRERLAVFKVPTHVWFYEKAEFPRNPAGKVMKRELKEDLLADG